ncbi:hypothetical protein P4115_00120 [Pseudomonas aeruginosa]|nr:hypothetical protein [Pseudomonas aeruginosa]
MFRVPSGLPARLLLPADAWRMQMKDLSNHYGSDASLDPETETVILDFLLQASVNNRLPMEGEGSGFPPRITETRWFLKKHDEIRPSTFKRRVLAALPTALPVIVTQRGGTLTRIGSKYPRLATRVQMSSWLCRSSN